MWNYSFHNNFCQKIIVYLESLYNKLYFDIKFISKYWKMNSKSWQDGLFHGTKWRENYQCSLLWWKKSVLSRFWIHLSVFRNKFNIKIKLIVQAFQIYNYLLTEIIIKRIYFEILKDEFKILTGRTFSRNKMARKLCFYFTNQFKLKKKLK
jgi:hypothetical protein